MTDAWHTSVGAAEVIAGASVPSTQPATSIVGEEHPISPALQMRLAELNSTPLDHLDSVAGRSLAEFTAPTDQAQIEYSIACQYGSGGAQYRERSMQHAKRALDHLVALDKRIQMYHYIATATEASAGADRTGRRVKTAPIYAQALSEIQTLDLPAVAPEAPLVQRFDYRGPPGDPVYQTLLEAYNKSLAEAERARDVQRLITQRDSIFKGLAWLYRDDGNRQTNAEAVLRKYLTNEKLIAATLEQIDAVPGR